MEKVRAKKHLGQHFLNDKSIAQKIAEIIPEMNFDSVIEIGPGMGVLTEFLFPVWKEKFKVIEIDRESVAYLKNRPWAQGMEIIPDDFLRLKSDEIFAGENNAIIGNYPYNISTEIAFKVIDNFQRVLFFGGMFQREVARRFCSVHGNKEYGVTSVLLQSLYDCKYEFSVDENAFSPPPKVKSGIISCIRKAEMEKFDYKSLSLVVKTAFNQRRKTLNNALKPLTSSRTGFTIPEGWSGKRAEQLSVSDFIHLAQAWQAAT
jgi:16S rRNA (adenine1518-N6/adenine1519-N6)-dimethyltransferase